MIRLHVNDFATKLRLPFRWCVDLPMGFFKKIVLKTESEKSQRHFWNERWSWDPSRWVSILHFFSYCFEQELQHVHVFRWFLNFINELSWIESINNCSLSIRVFDFVKVLLGHRVLDPADCRPVAVPSAERMNECRCLWCSGFLWFWCHLVSLVLTLRTLWRWETGTVRKCALDVRSCFWTSATHQRHLLSLKRYKPCLLFFFLLHLLDSSNLLFVC